MYINTATENEFSSSSSTTTTRKTETYHSGYEVKATAKAADDGNGVTLPPTIGSGTTGPK